LIKRIKNSFLFWGFDPRILIYNILGFPSYFKDYRAFKRKSKIIPAIKFGKIYPVLGDKFKPGGYLTDHYFYQDLLVASCIFRNNPIKHIDIGSRVDGFVAHVASFREIEVFDIRPIKNEINNVKFLQIDFMNPDKDLNDYTDSVSCLHAIEHFGLGRYGDTIDPEGHLKGLNSISKVLRKGGKFYFSSPIGPLRVEFNAHRVFSISYLLDIFKENYKIDKFSFIDDKKKFHENAVLTPENILSNFGCRYGCGIFEMTKI
jgi:SAM-dependent methyltransferase